MAELYAEHPVMFRNHPVGFIISLLLILAFGVGLLILLWWYLKNKSSKLSVTEHDILLEKGLLSKVRAEVSITRVRTVRISQTFFNRIFGVGKVEIYTAGDKPEIVASGLPEPNRIRELIKARQTGGSQG